MVTVRADPVDDAELLSRYAVSRSEEAFAELVRRHLDLVHSAALRQAGGNAAAAADIAQMVFIELARQAGTLSRHPALIGWLYTTTHRLAARYLRTESRRRRREEEAQHRQQLQHSAEPVADWGQLAPVLDAALNELGESDRLALLWRHFERRPFSEVGARLGLNEHAARMRVDRALDKLRGRLAKRGIHSTSAALTVALSGPVVVASPPQLAASITLAAVAATPLALSTFGFLTVMSSTPLKLAATALVCGVVATLLVVRQESAHRQREADLTRQLNQARADLQSVEEGLRQSEQERLRQAASTEELLRLRRDVAALRRAAGSPGRATETNAVALPASASRISSTKFAMTIPVTIPAGSTLLTDKWTTRDGKVAFALVTPTSIGTTEAPQVSIMARVFECTEERVQELSKALGGSHFVSEEQRRERALADGVPYRSRTQSAGLFTEDQLKTFLAHLESAEGVDQLMAPGVTTASGRQAQVGMLSDSPDDPVNGLMLNFVPTLTEQGDVELLMNVDREGDRSDP
ncbi:MAG: sigma-70 family RNA polymerase sigma factor [Verrucomicrobia bacterium]|nr:sigma-70 family RNA polymerase sigma factor [Verrucomicrobiota bacterium]